MNNLQDTIISYIEVIDRRAKRGEENLAGCVKSMDAALASSPVGSADWIKCAAARARYQHWIDNPAPPKPDPIERADVIQALEQLRTGLVLPEGRYAVNRAIKTVEAI